MLVVNIPNPTGRSVDNLSLSRYREFSVLDNGDLSFSKSVDLKWERAVQGMSPQLYYCFYCHVLYDGNGQGWGAYWNLTPTVAFLYMKRCWSGRVNFERLISIRALQCTGSDQWKMWYALLLAVLSCFSWGILTVKWGGIFTEKNYCKYAPFQKFSHKT